MNFLVDAQLPPALCRWLIEREHRARHVTDLLPGAAGDAGIAALAEREDLILMSKDDDFLVHRLPDRFVFLWLRCGNATNKASRPGFRLAGKRLNGCFSLANA